MDRRRPPPNSLICWRRYPGTSSCSLYFYFISEKLFKWKRGQLRLTRRGVHPERETLDAMTKPLPDAALSYSILFAENQASDLNDLYHGCDRLQFLMFKRWNCLPWNDDCKGVPLPTRCFGINSIFRFPQLHCGSSPCYVPTWARPQRVHYYFLYSHRIYSAHT